MSESGAPGGLAVAERPKRSDALRALLDAKVKKRLASAGQRAIPRRAGDGPAPLSFAQRRLWFLDRYAPASSAYNIARAVTLTGDLDTSALRAAIAAVEQRHEILRTVIETVGEEPMQRVRAAAETAFAEVDLSALPSARSRAVAELLASRQARRAFDLRRGPVLLWSLLRLEDRHSALVLTIHHIVSDGLSIDILFREIAALYRAALEGCGAGLAELPIQYLDYAAWEQQRLKGTRVEAMVGFWRQRLEGLPPVLELPTDRPRPPVRSFEGGRVEAQVPAEVTSRLRSLAAAEDSTLFMAVLSAWAALVFRYSGQTDVAIGTPVVGRDQSQLEGLVGMFVNTLVLRLDVSGRPSFRQLLERARHEVLETHQHRELPFEKLVEELAPERSLSHTPLFQIMLSLHPRRQGNFELPGARIAPMAMVRREARFDFALEVAENAVGLDLMLFYSRDLFEHDTARRWLRHLSSLIAGAVADPGLPIAELALLDETERRQQLVDWNATAVDYAGPDTLHELLDAQAERTPEAVAVVFGDHHVTYRRLHAEVHRLARFLRRQGAGPEDLVGVLMERSVDLVVALLAVVEAGAAYVPLDPDYPDSRLSFMLEDFRADRPTAVVLTHQRWLGKLPAESGDLRAICLDTEGAAITAESREPLPCRLGGESLAYMIYTSGSTGKPKGAMNSHRAIRNRLLWMQDAFPLTGDDCVVQKTPFSFDVSVWEFFWPLVVGSRLVLATPGGHQQSDYLADLIVRERVSTLHFVPSMLQVFLAEPASRMATGVTRVIASGEALPPELERRFFDRLPAELHNLYGPTEAAIDVSHWPCDRRSRKPVVPIGRPIANVVLRVLDPGLALLPIGAAGELMIGGVGLARGYHRRPRLAAEKFIPDPFATELGARLYRTGDLARTSNDGTIEFLGRLDHQVKLRGFRIELGEIESLLGQHPAVRQVTAVVRERASDPRLVAYLVPQEELAAPICRALELAEQLEGELHELPNGMAVAHRNPAETDYLYREIFEDQTYLRHGITLEDGDCVFDVGSNIGLFSLFVAARARGARLFAFEPIPPVCATARLNATLYGLDAEVFELGLAEKAGEAEFTYYPNVTLVSGRFAELAEEREAVMSVVESELADDASGELTSRDLEELVAQRLSAETVTCELATLSSVIQAQGVERIDLLKIDVEKSELEVLAGLADEDWPKVRQVVVEVHDVGGRLAVVRELLESRGFSVVAEQDGMLRKSALYNLYGVRCPRPAAAVEAASPEAWSWSSRERLAADLRRLAEARLPEYMVPSHLVLLDKMPLSPNGKVDRKALPEPMVDRSQRAYVAPATPTEEILAGLWRELLGVDRVGAADRFFDLGGHSLLATRLSARLRGLLDCDLPVRSIFEHPRLSALAAELDRRLSAGRTAEEADPIRRVSRAAPLPPSFGQERLWFLDQLLHDRAVYNIPTASRLRGELDVGALAAACGQLAARHEVLRTRFEVQGGVLRQAIGQASPVAVPVVDLVSLPAPRRLAVARRLAAAEAARVFDLGGDALWRIGLLRLATEDHVLLATFHHTVADGWSLGIFGRELGELYDAARESQRPSLRPLPFQYADFAVWQRAWLSGEELQRQVAYWRERFEGAPQVLDLPISDPRPALQTFRAALHRQVLPKRLSAQLRAIGQRSGATFFMTLLACFKTLLWRISGQADLVVGTPIANRQHLETEKLIGLFANFLGLRTRLDGEGSFRRLLESVRDAALGAYAHQDLPFERLVEEIRPARDLSRHPLVQVVFLLDAQGGEQGTGMLGVPGTRAEPFDSGHRTVKYDLALVAEDREDSLVSRLEYNADLFEPTAIARLSDAFQTLLESLAAEPDAALEAHSLLSRAARHQVVREWNDTVGPYTESATLPALFEARLPDVAGRPAVVFEGGSWTYRELDRRANRLARQLRSEGVGRGDLVGVILDRSPEMLTAVLAAVKAGAAYVPFDVAWPEQRVRTVLERMDVRWLIVDPPRLAAVEALADLPELVGAVCLGGEPERSSVPGLRLVTEGTLAGLPDTALAPAAGPDDVAYVIFTSGSTGEPKGVMVQHRAAVNLIEWVNRTFEVSPDDRLLFVTALTFDLSVYDVFGMLAAGGSVRIARRDELRDPERLTRILVDEPITFWDSAPAALQQLARFLPRRRELEHSPALRRVFLSGDWIPVSLPDRLRETFPDARVVSLGGATEATIWSNVFPVGEVDPAWPSIPYGRPITNARYHVLDRRLAPCPIGVPGDLYIADLCLSAGYARSPILTASKYLPDPGGSGAGARLYRTGDRARYLADGNLQFLGRSDTQVKVRGYRIELGEIESVLGEQPGVSEAVVLVRRPSAQASDADDQRLVAYYVPEGRPAPEAATLRAALARRLPEYMLPSAFVALESWPLAPTGKLDRKALPEPEAWQAEPAEAPAEAAGEPAPATGNRAALEQRLVSLWREVLSVERVGLNDNFFDLGGHSLLLVQVHSRLPELLGRPVAMTELFRFPTIASLSDFLWGEDDEPLAAPTVGSRSTVAADSRGEIAVIGMAGRFASAGSVDELWRKLRGGEEMIRFFSEEELREAGFDDREIADPRFVKARGALDGPELFDARFFGIPPREARILDPQHRHFLEVAHQALEVAGYGAPDYRDRVGVYAGASANTYLPRLLASSDLARQAGPFELQISNHPDYLPTRVSYKLGLDGPSVNVQTACSTSLVAIHMACRALADGECDLALAGGVSVAYREVGGHLFEDGGVQSPDGHTRTFDAGARGVTTGSGAGVVVLKRLADALRDGDTIDAVVLGTASNNDGSLRAGFTAPSSEGQATVIRDAQIRGGVDPETITYVEAHGTGTALGDPIEVAGLTQAFRSGTERTGYCALGAVKTNLGHLDAAAGVAGFIKTVLALKHREIPPSLHFQQPNPKIDFASSPFYVSSALEPWQRNGTPRRAGVSSFGIGGTNAHAVLEEAPLPEPTTASREWQILPLSGRSPEAVERSSRELARHLEEHGELDVADVAFTLQQGRRAFRHRRVVVCASRDQAIRALGGEAPRNTFDGGAEGSGSLAFLFPGQGAQHPAMARQLYRDEPVFREHLDRCLDLLHRESGLDLRRLLDDETEASAAELEQTAHAQPALFAVETSLAALLASWGLAPEALLGHSLGEYVAACLAGVLTLEDGLRLTAARGRLMQALPPGRMMAVSLAADEAVEVAESLAPGELSVATISGPSACVLAGRAEAMERLAAGLEDRGVTHRRLHASHAFHSPMMEPVLAPFRAEVARIDLRPPRIPFVSNLTGTWIRDVEATDPDYWCEQLRRPVQLDAGLKALLEPGGRALLEVGPGRQLATVARQHPDRSRAKAILTSLPPPRAAEADSETLTAAVGRLWAAGLPVDWRARSAGERRRRVPLPTYPFDRQRFWIDRRPERIGETATPEAAELEVPAASGVGEGGRPAEERSAEQIAVAEAFGEILGVEDVGLHDDFFELGGSSLSALRLPSLLKSRLGVEMPSTSLLEAATVASLAEMLAEATAGDTSRPAHLVRLQPRGAGRPLFMVHPVGGTVYWFRDLARAITSRPFYALRSPGLAAGEQTLGSVEEMAVGYLEAVRSVQPAGPYFVGGSSMGGSVAFEMVRQLRQAGDEVSLLVLLDSPCLDQLPPRPDNAELLVSVFEGKSPLSVDELRRLPESEQLGAVLQAATVDPDAVPTDSPAVGPEEIERLYRVSRANVHALYTHRPEPQPCSALFFRAMERDDRQPELPWVSLCQGGIEIRPAAGNHVSMNYPPHVSATASYLARRLEQEERR